MNNIEVDFSIAKMLIKLKDKLHQIGIVDWPIDLDLLTDIMKSNGDIFLEYVYNKRIDVQDGLVELIANSLAKKIENAGMELPVFGAVICYPYFIGERVGLMATYIYGNREKK